MNDRIQTKLNLQSYVKPLIIFLLFFVSVFWLEHTHLLRSSVKDDLNYATYFCNTGFLQVVFSHGYKFRPVSNFTMWIVSVLCKGNLYLYGYINIFLAAVCAFIIYLMVKKYIGTELLAGIAAFLYITSRFSYYQITTQLGIMETTSSVLGIIFVWTLFEYMDTLNSRYFNYALLVYALCSLSHERYTVLMPVLLYAWFVSGERKQKNKKTISYYQKPIVTLIVFVVIMLSFKLLVNNVLAGTGGTVVTETITIESMIKHLIESIGYLFAINSSETWLTMIGWDDYLVEARVMVIISIFMIILIVGISAYEIIRLEKTERNRILALIGIFLLSVGALIFISSVTIRVELRWMYFPYMAAVFLLLYLCQIKGNKYTYIAKKICIVVYALVLIGFGIYCRDYYGNLYYWQDYMVANALSDSTYGEYKENMYSRDWVIISPLELTNSYYDIMKQFDVFDEYELNVEVIKSVNELDSVNNILQKEILYFDTEKYCFVNVTNMINAYLEGVSTQ